MSTSRRGVRRGAVGFSAPNGTLLVIHLVGGVDGLSVVVPWGDSAYQRRRPDIAVASPGERCGAIDLGNGLGLHPALAPLYNGAGRAERLAVICGVGMPDGLTGERSHLPTRDFMHRGGRNQAEGWATRVLRFEGLGGEAAWSFGPGPHPMFSGMPDAIAAPRPPVSVSKSDRLARGYPEGRLGRSLAATADMVRYGQRDGDGLRLAAIDHDGYDTHVDQGDGRSGVLAHRLDRLARGLAAFWSDIESIPDRRAHGPVTVVVVSEFGRSIDQNDSGGTEHGRAGVALALGDQVIGGIHGDFPSVRNDDVWPVSIDIRRVLADAVASHGFRPWKGGVFPDLALPNRSLGLLLSP